MSRFVTPGLLGLAILISTFVSAMDASTKKLPFKTRIASADVHGAGHIIAADRARIEHIKADAALRQSGHQAGAFGGGGKNIDKSRLAHSVNVTNAAITYTATVEVAGATHELLIDTGSSNTWIGNLVPYNTTNCTTTDFFFVIYGSGAVLGDLCSDEMRLSDDLVIRNQTFGVSVVSIGFNTTDGILGIGPPDLTIGTHATNDSIPTVTDNLFAQGTIDTESIGIFYAPTTEPSVKNGELTFGGVDEAQVVGDIAYTPLTTTTPAATYWGVDQTVSYGDSQILPLSAGIVDTGTTLVYLATDAFNAYVNATGAVLDSTTGLLTITEDQYASLQPLTFNIGTAGSYSLSPNAQIWPRALNAVLGGNDTAIYLIVANIGHPSGQGMDFIDGYTFLERYYTVYDTTYSRFGIAPTQFTNATTN